jgi:hypothetical protein
MLTTPRHPHAAATGLAHDRPAAFGHGKTSCIGPGYRPCQRPIFRRNQGCPCGVSVVPGVAPKAHSATLTWRPTQGTALTAGFSYVGMTTSAQGVAIAAGQSLHAVWFTYDGGKRWQASPVR